MKVEDVMETFDEIKPEVVKKYIGYYIRFGGQGILDGLKQPPTKQHFFRLLEVVDDGGLILRGYHRRKFSLVPVCHFHQQWQVITPNEFKQLPII